MLTPDHVLIDYKEAKITGREEGSWREDPISYPHPIFMKRSSIVPAAFGK